MYHSHHYSTEASAPGRSSLAQDDETSDMLLDIWQAQILLMPLSC